MRGTWPIGLTIAGLGFMGLEWIVIAPASSSRMGDHLGGTTIAPSLESILVQVLLVGCTLPILAVGLALRSRRAYVVAFLIGLVPAVAWAYLLVTGNAVALRPLTILLVIPALMVLIGLGLSWHAFWRASPDR